MYNQLNLFEMYKYAIRHNLKSNANKVPVKHPLFSEKTEIEIE